VPRRNLSGRWGETATITLRLPAADRELLAQMAAGWSCSQSEVLRRALREAAAREQSGRGPLKEER